MSQRVRRLKSVAAVLLCICCFRPMAAQSDRRLEPEIDFISATINGRPAFELTVAGISELIGAGGKTVPAYTDSKYHFPVAAQLLYPSSGLQFSFSPARSDPKERLYDFVVYLAPKRGAINGADFLSFDGTLSKGVNSHWPVEAFATAFAEYHPFDPYVTFKRKMKEFTAQEEEINRKERAIGVPESHVSGEDERKLLPLYSSLRIQFKDHFVDAAYNPETKFLERIEVTQGSR